MLRPFKSDLFRHFDRYYMIFDFIEIGSHFVDTLQDGATDSTVGLIVEPIKEYLDWLPSFPLIAKEPVAIVTNPKLRELPIFYVGQEDIERYRLHSWLNQCNSVGFPHPWHTGYYENADRTGSCRDLMSLGIVKTRPVKCITFRELAQKHSVTGLKFLKVDAEGYDSWIVNAVLDYFLDERLPLPLKIQFETNFISDQKIIMETRQRLATMGYVNRLEGVNTISELSNQLSGTA